MLHSRPPPEGALRGFSDVVLALGGSSAPSLVKLSRKRPDEVLLDVTGLDKTIEVRGKVVGAQNGSVLLERR